MVSAIAGYEVAPIMGARDFDSKLDLYCTVRRVLNEVT